MWQRGDIVIVGGGPVGCVVALCLAQKGARVTLVEAGSGDHCRDLAGEWIHPAGVAILSKLGLTEKLESCPSVRTLGFLLHRDPDSLPLRLEYPHGLTGLCCTRPRLLSVLRASVLDQPRITYLAAQRVVAVGDSFVLLSTGSRVGFDYLIGADGRGSLVRRTLYGPARLEALSLTVGLELAVAELPHEGFGRVVVGTHGPVLIYRLDPATVRICFDLPIPLALAVRRDPRVLWKSCDRDVPSFLRAPFQFALEKNVVLRYGANHRSRSLGLGRGRRILVGDAAGVIHPLSAFGLSSGFEDANRLAESGSCQTFRLGRLRRRAQAMFLGTTLYWVFTDKGPAGEAVREVAFETLQARARSSHAMHFLAGQDQSTCSLVPAILALYWSGAARAFRRRSTTSLPARVGCLLASGGKIFASLRVYGTYLCGPAAAAIGRLVRMRFA